jgi:hypothetical protein
MNLPGSFIALSKSEELMVCVVSNWRKIPCSFPEGGSRKR